MHQQGRSRHARACGPQPPQRIQKADAGRIALLESGRWPDDQAYHVIEDGEDGQFFQHTGHGCAVKHVHGHRRLQLTQRGFDLPADAVQHRPVIGMVERGVEQGRAPRDLVGANPWCADLIPDLAYHQGRWPCREGRGGKPPGTGLRLQPFHQWSLGTQGGAPPGPRQALPLASAGCPAGQRADPAPHGRQGRLDEGSQMRRRTPPSVRHQHIPGGSGRVDPWEVGEIRRA